jgi:hypothetical protein
LRIRLIRKIADIIDGIDLSRRKAGEIVEVSARDAAVLFAEGWAEAAPARRRSNANTQPASNDAARSPRTKKR